MGSALTNYIVCIVSISDYLWGNQGLIISIKCHSLAVSELFNSQKSICSTLNQAFSKGSTYRQDETSVVLVDDGSMEIEIECYISG